MMDAAPDAPPDQEHPDWSSDGERLVFETGFSSLWVVSSDGLDLHSVYECVAPCSSLQDGAWSPDGREIAFMVAETEDGTTTSRSAIVSLDVASGTVRTIYEDTSGRVWLFHPRWSGDGEAVVFEQDTFASDLLSESTITKRAIKVVSSSGDAVPDNVVEWDGPVSGPGAPDPDWSSVENLIVFSRDDNLFTVRPDGTSERQLTQFDAVTEHAIQPTFTPDGTGIVFTFVTGQFGADDVPAAAIIDLDGADMTPVGGGVPMTHTRIQP